MKWEMNVWGDVERDGDGDGAEQAEMGERVTPACT